MVGVPHTNYEWIQRMCVGELSDTKYNYGYLAFFFF